MQEQITKLNTKINHFLRKNYIDINRVEIEEVVADIDNFISIVQTQNQLRSDISKIFCETFFGENKVNIVHIIAKFGSIEQLTKVVEIAGVGIVNMFDNNWFSPLHYSAINGRDDLVKSLINFEADRHALTSPETRKWHSIHFACRYGHLKIVKILIDLEINIEIRTGFGLTPLHVACEFGKFEIVKYLLSLGAQKDPITIDENQNMTPLHYAVVGNFLGLTELLLISGADKNKCDIKGYSSIDIASKNNLIEMVKLFLRWGVKNIESPLQIATSLNHNEIKEIIQKYLNAKKCLFDKNSLKKLTPELIEMMGKFNGVNLFQPMVKIFGNVEFNAFGIFNLTNIVGFFSKREIDFVQFSEDHEIIELCEALDRVKEILVNGHGELIKISLENI